MTRDENRNSPLQTVDRALHVLNLFTPGEPEVSVSQVAVELGVNRSIASRLLAALEARNFVVQDQVTGRFRLGVRNLDLGALYLQSHRLVVAASPYLEQLGKRGDLRCTSNLFVLDGGRALRLASFPARPLTRLRVPLHCTASGKVLLASLDAGTVDRIVNTYGLPGRTPYTITNRDGLDANLQVVSHQGYALDAQENELHSHCVAAPVTDVSRRTVAAVSVSVTGSMIEASRQDRLIEAVTEAGGRISEIVGSGVVGQWAPCETRS